MRTTLTLDPDVAATLRRLVERRRASFKSVVNEALRAGLAALGGERRPVTRPYRVKPTSLGRPRLPNVDNITEVLAVAEGEQHL